MQQNKNKTAPLYTALDNLIDSDLVIKEADKGSGIVIMEQSFYDGKIKEMLSNTTYEKVDIDCTFILQQVISFAKLHKKF